MYIWLIFISSNTVLILICLIQYHWLNYEIACKIFSTFDVITLQTCQRIYNKILLYCINQKQSCTDLTSARCTVEMLDLLSVFLCNPNTVTMVPLLTIVTTTVGKENKK